MIEVPIEPDVRPYAVWHAGKWVWVSKPGASFARVAFSPILKGGLGELSTQTIHELIRVARECQWGSVHPLTREGLAAALAYPIGYGYAQVTPLASPDVDLEALGLSLKVGVANWLPSQTIVVLPVDRMTAAQVMTRGPDLAALLLDPSRSFGFAVRDL